MAPPAFEALEDVFQDVNFDQSPWFYDPIYGDLSSIPEPRKQPRQPYPSKYALDRMLSQYTKVLKEALPPKKLAILGPQTTGLAIDPTPAPTNCPPSPTSLHPPTCGRMIHPLDKIAARAKGIYLGDEPFTLAKRVHPWDEPPCMVNGVCSGCHYDAKWRDTWTIAEILAKESEENIWRPLDNRKDFVADVWTKYGYKAVEEECFKTKVERCNNYLAVWKTVALLKTAKEIGVNKGLFLPVPGEEDEVGWDYGIEDTGMGTKIVLMQPLE